MKSIYVVLGLLLSLTATGGYSTGGSAIVGGGGQTILCRTSNGQNPIELSLDYVVEAAGHEAEVAPVASLEASLLRIAHILDANRNTVPYFAFIFNEFRKDVYNTSDDTHYNFWEAMPNGLGPTKDQNLERPLPPSCLTNGVPNIQQAFQRFGSRFNGQGTETTLYRFDPKIINRLKAQPIQLSFLLVHEWLWLISGDVRLNRRINFFLHSKAIETINYNEVHSALEKLGLDFARIGMFPNERLTRRFAHESRDGNGPDTMRACIEPRREHAALKKQSYDLPGCRPLQGSGRIATINYYETTNCTKPNDCYCRINWTFLCLASP